MRLRSPFALALPFTLALIGAATGTGTGCGSDTGGNGGGGSAPVKKDGTVVVLFTSDEHSHVFAFSPELDDYPHATKAGSGPLVGGVARRAAILARERKAASDAGKESITVSSGDNQMGTLAQVAFESASVDYGTMKALGYDVTTLGNHEFDFGPRSLAKSISAAKAGSGLPPIVASNIHFADFSPDDDSLAAYFSDKIGDSAPVHPYHVVTTKSGIKVGVIGYVGANAERVATVKFPVKFSSFTLSPALEGDAEAVLPELYKDLQPKVDTLRNTEKVDLVIALSHAGLGNVSTPELTQKGEDYQIAENVSGIDLIISGHSHLADPKPITVKNKTSGREVLILNGGAYGQHVGRVEMMVHADGSPPMWMSDSQKLMKVDEETAPDGAMASASDLLLASIEKANFGSGPAYLPSLLSRVTGKPVTDDAQKPGDLYFYPLGKTSFDLGTLHQVCALSADAMLASADQWAKDNGNVVTDIGLEAASVVRSTMLKGKTGTISAADAFNVVPLGVSPVDGSLGYPLVRAYVSMIELRGLLENVVTYGPINDQIDVIPSGMCIEYDMTFTPALSAADLGDPTKGRVRRIALDTNHADGVEQCDKLILDLDNNIYVPGELYSVVTSSYIAQFAKDNSVTLKDAMGNTVALKDIILHRADQSEVKQIESFFSYINASTTLSSVYDVSSPLATQRMKCVKGC